VTVGLSVGRSVMAGSAVAFSHAAASVLRRHTGGGTGIGTFGAPRCRRGRAPRLGVSRTAGGCEQRHTERGRKRGSSHSGLALPAADASESSEPSRRVGRCGRHGRADRPVTDHGWRAGRHRCSSTRRTWSSWRADESTSSLPTNLGRQTRQRPDSSRPWSRGAAVAFVKRGSCCDRVEEPLPSAPARQTRQRPDPASRRERKGGRGAACLSPPGHLGDRRVPGADAPQTSWGRSGPSGLGRCPGSRGSWGGGPPLESCRLGRRLQPRLSFGRIISSRCVSNTSFGVARRLKAPGARSRSMDRSGWCDRRHKIPIGRSR
jgi:hypothetical protein